MKYPQRRLSSLVWPPYAASGHPARLVSLILQCSLGPPILDGRYAIIDPPSSIINLKHIDFGSQLGKTSTKTRAGYRRQEAQCFQIALAFTRFAQGERALAQWWVLIPTHPETHPGM